MEIAHPEVGMVYLNPGVLLDAITAEIADALTSMDAAAVERTFAARSIGPVAPKKGSDGFDPRTLAWAVTQLTAADNIVAAISQLSMRELTVLRALWRSGPAVRTGTINPAFASVLNPTALAECLAMLQDRALLLPADAERTALFIPICVRSVLLGRNGPARPAAAVLAAYKVEDIQRMANKLGAGIETHRKADRVAQIVEQMSHPVRIKERVAALPDLARGIFDHILAAGGSVDPWSLLRTFPQINTKQQPYAYSYYPYNLYQHGDGNDGPVLLETLGLVLRYPPDWATQLVIADDVLTALLPPLNISPTDLIEPEFELPPAAARPAGGQPAPVLDVVDCLQFVDEMRPALTQKGLFAKPDAKRLARWLSINKSPYADFIFAMTLQAGLLSDTAPQLRVDKKTDAWLQEEELAQRSALLEGWRGLAIWRDDREDGYTRSNDWQPLLLQFRAATVEVLAQLPEGGASTESVVRRLKYRIPALFLPLRPKAARECPAPEAWLLGVLRSLSWLGLVEPLLQSGKSATPVGLRLTPAGRALLAGNASFKPDAEIPRSDRLIVQPTLDVLAPPNADPAVYRAVRRFTDPVSSVGMRTAKLSAGSLRRAIDSGMSAAHVRTFLEQHGNSSLPNTIDSLLGDVEAKYGRIHVGRASTYLTVDDPHLLLELQADRRLAGLVERIIAPTVALVHGEGLALILERLRAAGHMPVHDRNEPATGVQKVGPPVQPSGGGRTLPATGAGARPIMHEGNYRVVAFQSRAASNERVAAANAAGERATSRTAIRNVLEMAYADRTSVEMEYRVKVQGREQLTTSTIDITYFDGNYLRAYCHLRDREREFKLERIHWARCTGEPALFK